MSTRNRTFLTLAAVAMTTMAFTTSADAATLTGLSLSGGNYQWPTSTLLADNEQVSAAVNSSSGHDLKSNRDQGNTFTISQNGTIDLIAMNFESFKNTGTADFTFDFFEVVSATDPTQVGATIDSLTVSAADVTALGFANGDEGTLVFDVINTAVTTGGTYALQFDTPNDSNLIMKWRRDNPGSYTGGKSFGNTVAAPDYHFGVYAGPSPDPDPDPTPGADIAVISVDLDITAGTIAGDFTGSFTTGTSTTWNSLVVANGNVKNIPAPKTSGPLTTMDGSATQNPVTLTLGTAGQTYNTYEYFNPPQYALRRDYIFLRANGGAGWGPQSSLDFFFGGLIPNGTYDVKFFTPGNPASVTVGGSGPTNVAVNDVGTFTGLTADGSGILSGSFTQVAGNNDGSMAGIQIQGSFVPEPATIPEPATMCALGLAVAGLGGYVRKRRKA